MKICFILGENPEFLGGITLYLKNLLRKIPKRYEVFWTYRGNKNKTYKKENINYIEIKVPRIYLLKDIVFNLKVNNFLKKHDFDIINSHAIWGYWMKFYKKKKQPKIIHTYHGTAIPYYKCHLKRFNIAKRILYWPLLLFAYFIEKPPIKKADKIICVSEHVKKEVQKLYGKGYNIKVIRTGVDLNKFKPRNKKEARKKLKLDANKLYGLYVGRGGFWTKGLDRVVKLSEELYLLNKNYRLIIIGADKEKVQHLIDKDFIIFYPTQTREKMPLYYNASDIFFCLSRYEGGAPTLVVSEAMASGCLLVCSKDSEQEIIEDKKNALILENFDKKDAEKILEFYNNKELKDKIIKNSIKTIKEMSLDKWGEKIYKIFSI